MQRKKLFGESIFLSKKCFLFEQRPRCIRTFYADMYSFHVFYILLDTIHQNDIGFIIFHGIVGCVFNVELILSISAATSAAPRVPKML